MSSFNIDQRSSSPISAISNTSNENINNELSSDSLIEKSAEKLSRKKYKKEKEESEHEWNTLPDSVIGTLIYFLLVEHDGPDFNIWETVWILILVGFPVYFTYLIQVVILYELWTSLPSLGDPINSGFCTNDYQLNLVALAFFFVQVYYPL